MTPHLKFDFTFPRNYQVKTLESAPLAHPLEKLYHYPTELEEGDRSGVYLRVVPQHGLAWSGFFALGFESDQVVNAVCSCPDPDSLCGLAWTSERLSWEGISITEISGQKLCGLGWDALTDKQVSFEVDLRTGRHTGGARPGDQPEHS